MLRCILLLSGSTRKNFAITWFGLATNFDFNFRKHPIVLDSDRYGAIRTIYFAAKMSENPSATCSRCMKLFSGSKRKTCDTCRVCFLPTFTNSEC